MSKKLPQNSIDKRTRDCRKFKGRLSNRLLNACAETATIAWRHLLDNVD